MAAPSPTDALAAMRAIRSFLEFSEMHRADPVAGLAEVEAKLKATHDALAAVAKPTALQTSTMEVIQAILTVLTPAPAPTPPTPPVVH